MRLEPKQPIACTLHAVGNIPDGLAREASIMYQSIFRAPNNTQCFFDASNAPALMQLTVDS
jgi:hypothetical protein